MSFGIFIGIDQTGATNSKGLPRALHCSLIDDRGSRAKFKVGLDLPSLTHADILKVLREHVSGFEGERVLICVDSVLGLPAELNVSIAKVLRLARDYSFAGKAYGAITAYHFFDQFLPPGAREDLPKRLAETLVGANSVFNLKPFQRNIGCGSYRVLKDLSKPPRWFSMWPLESAESQFVVAEGYPSYFWKSLLQSRTRNLELIRVRFPKLEFKTHDQADSFMLAYGAWKSTELLTMPINRRMKREGWILGLRTDRELPSEIVGS